MSTVLTEFVRQMEPGGVGPSEELFDQMWDALRGLLGAEMKRRNCWSAPPAYLGVVGHALWTAPGQEADALDELASECFEWVFIRRLRSLRDQATRKSSVDGLVALATRHFLLEMQRRNDPLGFRLFEVLRRIVAKGLAMDRLRLLAGDTRIRNDSLLGPVATEQDTPKARPSVDELIEGWVGDHVDGLVTASRGELAELVELLAGELAEWLEAGGSRSSVRFGDLAAHLKTQGRGAWGALFEHTGFVAEGGRGATRTPEPARLQRFAELSRCVRRRLDRGDLKAKTRLYLERLWSFLETFAVGEELPGLDPEELADLPSHRRLARLLDVPRERIPGLLEILGESLEACRRKVSSNAEVLPMIPDNPSDSPRQRARAKAQAALREIRQIETRESEGSTRGQLRPGDIVTLPDRGRPSALPGVYWLLLGDAEDGRRRSLPVDTFPLIGPGDRPLPPLGDEAPWICRAELELGLHPEDLEQARVVDHLENGRLAAARNPVDLEGLQVVDPELPAYRDWIEQGPELARRRLAERPLPFRSSEPQRAERADEYTPAAPSPWGWLAALLAVGVLGLGVHFDRVNHDLHIADQPIVGLPNVEVEFRPTTRGPLQIHIPEEATHIRVVLFPTDRFDERLYRIELMNRRHLVYRSPDLEPADAFDLTFPVKTLQKPNLVFVLYGLRQGEWVRLDREPVHVIFGAKR